MYITSTLHSDQALCSIEVFSWHVITWQFCTIECTQIGDLRHNSTRWVELCRYKHPFRLLHASMLALSAIYLWDRIVWPCKRQLIADTGRRLDIPSCRYITSTAEWRSKFCWCYPCFNRRLLLTSLLTTSLVFLCVLRQAMRSSA